MKKLLVCMLLLSSTATLANEDSEALNACISAWRTSPFKKGTDDYKTIGAKVNVLGIGGGVTDDVETKTPELVLIKPNVNVLGKTVFRLMNPNGWYCFKPTVAVLAKTQIEAHCKAHIASTSGGANVLGAKDKEQGVTVLGTLRIKTVGCESNH